MLQSIYIQNYALIDTLDISFGKGFSVITGETGAGKSIILGAIGLLLGQRADIKAIKNGATKCVIEARFDVSGYDMQTLFEENELEYDPHECILRRELQASGKSRAFVNDSPAPLSIMKELGERLIDVHSQHQNLLLSNEEFQLNVLDILAHSEDVLSKYKEAFSQYRSTTQELSKVIEEAEKSKADEDYVRFQLEQLEDAKLSAGEQQELEQEADMLSHAEEIKAGLYKVEQLLSGNEENTLGILKESISTLHSLEKVYTAAEEFSERLNSCYIELKDIAQEVGRSQEDTEFNPERLDFVNERLNLLYSLEQKHRVQSVEELISIREEYQEKLKAITSSDDLIEELKARKEKEYIKVKELAANLTEKRIEAAKEIQDQMRPRLIPLGMPNVRFVVELTNKKEPDASGADNVTFLFSANKNGKLQTISSVASGGEIARVMLSIKAMIAGTVQLPTIIFDEIDTGVSGEIADKMATIMQEMGECMQVISITHLPQIAAKGSFHYKVFKQDNETGTSSNIRLLNEEERIEEIAHMLSGATLTEAAVNNAKVLLQETRNYKETKHINGKK